MSARSTPRRPRTRHTNGDDSAKPRSKSSVGVATCERACAFSFAYWRRGPRLIILELPHDAEGCTDPCGRHAEKRLRPVRRRRFEIVAFEREHDIRARND